MKFKPYRMSRLNESLLGNCNMEHTDDDIEVVGSVPVTYADAITTHQELHKELEKRFKDFKSDAKEFVEDNHNREKTGKMTKEMEKMKLSEDLFEDVQTDEEDEGIVTESIDFGDPLNMGRGACSPTVPDYSSLFNEYVKALDTADEREKGMIKKTLTRFLYQLLDEKDTTENFNDYWTTRYPAVIDYIDKQINIIPQSLLSELFKNGNPLTEAPVAVEEPVVKKRTRGENEKKERRDYSSEDLWLAVYDELSATTDNEGEGQQVDKQIKARRGERYEHVYPHGETDIIIYATKPEEFEFARRVADHYGVEADEPKPDTNKLTNGFYKYSMVIHIPEDELYSEE